MDDGRRLALRTPENLGFSLTLAGPGIRFVAWLVDLAAISALSSVVSTLLGLLGIISLDFAAAAITVAYFIISVGYGMACEWFWRGQTVGKRLLKLRVMDAEGLKLAPYQVIIRNLFRPLDLLPALYLVGGAACLFTRKQQRLGDLAANTVVIRNPDPGSPDLEKVAAGKFNSFRAYRHLGARLRQLVSPEEASLAFQALLRRDELEERERVALFRELKEHFAAKAPFPPEAGAGLPDEQYVRNVVDILSR